MKIKDLKDIGFTDLPTTEEDKEIGRELSVWIGDTFIDWNLWSPQDQWTQIAKALRLHRLKIVEE